MLSLRSHHARFSVAPHSLRRIVVGVNASRAADAAAQAAIALISRQANARLAFCHVINMSKVAGNWDRGMGDYALPFDLARREARDVLRHFSKVAENAGLSAETRVLYGKAGVETAGFANDFNAGLIVIGNRPTIKVDRLLRGSTRDDVVKRSAVPVLLTTARPDTAVELPPRCILLPSADVPQNAAAARLARNLARVYGAEVVSMPAACSAQEEIDAIRTMAGDLEPGLLVVVRPPQSVWNRLGFPDIVERVLQEINVPTLVVQA
jgi:nucleotide-binding universal stress UspA family protein